MNLSEINREMDKLLMKYRSNGIQIDNETTQLDSDVRKDNEYEKPSSTSDIGKNTYLCHICDIHIPKDHKDDHLNGTTHIGLLKLANHATERIHKHVSQQIEQLPFNSKGNSNLSNNTNNNSYYCVQCNLLLDKDAEESHLSEEEHQKSVNRALFVDTLLKCYTGLNTEDVMAEISRWSSGYGTKVAEDSNKNRYSEDDVENNNDSAATVNISEKVLNKTARDSDAKTASVKTDSNVTKLFLQQLQMVLQTEIKEQNKSKSIEEIKYQSGTKTSHRELTVTELVHALSAKKPRVEIEVDATKVKEEVAEISDSLNPQQLLRDFSEEKIEVRALDGATLLVSKQHYHGIREASGALCCLLCTLVLRTAERFTEHIHSGLHVTVVAAPVEDGNGLRKVTNDGTIQLNCILCNTILLDPKKHISTEPHKEAMAKALPPQFKTESKIPYDISLTTADVEMVDQEKILKTREKTNKNKKKVKKPIQKSQRRTKYQNGFVFCNLCGVKVGNEMCIILTHVNGRRHQFIASKASVFDIEHNAPDMLAYFYYREQNARANWRVGHDFWSDVNNFL